MKEEGKGDGSIISKDIIELRTELANVYKSRNEYSDQVRNLAEKTSILSQTDLEQREEINRLQTQLSSIDDKYTQVRAILVEKDKAIQTLQDEVLTLQMEIGQIDIANDKLTIENKALLKRWMERVHGEAEKLNDANAFLERLKRLEISNEEKKRDGTVSIDPEENTF